MKLIECLNQLPDDMVMIDLIEIDRSKSKKTVTQLKISVKEWDDGYEIRDHKTNYGRTVKKCIGAIGGRNIFIED